jgi:hypothetical protein
MAGHRASKTPDPAARYGFTVITATHEHADRVVAIRDGKIISDVTRQPA